MVIYGEYVCCRVVFGTLVGVFHVSVMWSDIVADDFCYIPDSMLLAVRRWPTGGSASGPLEISPSGSLESRGRSVAATLELS